MGFVYRVVIKGPTTSACVGGEVGWVVARRVREGGCVIGTDGNESVPRHCLGCWFVPHSIHAICKPDQPR